MRIFYVGKAEDGVKVVEYGGSVLVWAPPGHKAVKKLLPVLDVNKKPIVREVISGPKKGLKIKIEKKQWVVELDSKGKPVSGPIESFHDLSPDAVRVVMNAANNEDGLLVVEAEYRKMQSIDDISLKIAELQKLKAEKELEERAAVESIEARAEADTRRQSAKDKLKDAAAHKDG